MDIDRNSLFTVLFSHHAGAVRRYLFKIIPKLDVAEELTQEAFARLQSSTRSHLESPRGFLFRTAHNLALDHLRRARCVPIDQIDDRAAELLADETPSPEEQVAAREELAIMRAIIMELPPKCRQVFLLVRIEGLSHRDVGSEMGMSQTMVRKYLSRAVDHIHARLGAGGR
ncbi:MAG: putative sigma-70 factor, subfamily protein [Rhodospirillales bacterium]|nr:putative sigma-70 factor, subfamily protein [Rhodospirillales bacterium]